MTEPQLWFGSIHGDFIMIPKILGLAFPGAKPIAIDLYLITRIKISKFSVHW
jgi:hypothetical protein